MTTSTSLHSNALNFMGFVQNGVDPRTGQYTVSVSLPEVQANELRGPSLPLRLAYNPLNSIDSGLGLGWSLSLTQFDPRKRVISLDSGESFAVDQVEPGGRMKMSEQKIDTFHLYDLGAGRYRVVHKSGTQEVLALRGADERSMAVPVEIYSQTGHGIRLGYSTYDGYPLLSSITDDTGQRLLTLERQGHQVQIALHPDAQVLGALAIFNIALRSSDNTVTRIQLPTPEQAAWRFEYARVLDQLRIVQVDTPTGSREQISYGDGGHEFPDRSGLGRLPRVTRHLIHPGAGQDSLDMRYDYGTDGHNFLGARLDIDWEDNGLDNLYRYIGDYQYRSTENLYVEGQKQRSIERTFNRFHLLTLEVTAQDNARQSVQTSYPLIDNVHFRDQPAKCQLATQVKTSWSIDGDPTQLRSEIVTSDFDDNGNLLRQEQANGMFETRTWYRADGSEDGCPADPEGFVRALRDKTVAPAADGGDAPTLRTEYRYTVLPALSGSDVHDWLAAQSETLVQADTGKQLQHTAFDYCNTPSDSFRHGRVERETRTMEQLATQTLYAWDKPPSDGLPVVQTTETTIGFDNTERSNSSQQSLHTGQTLQTLVDGVQTRYHYDTLNRLVEETIAPDSTKQASRYYRYQLCEHENDQASQSVTNARGVTTLTLLDGLGRAVREERDHVDEHNSALMLVIYQAHYDAWSRQDEETLYDWLDGQRLALTNRFDYDKWGNQSCKTGPDGVEYHQDIDPIGPQGAQQSVVHTWVQGAGADAPQSDHAKVWLNLFGKPDEQVSLDTQGQTVSRQTYVYDGLGRCTKSTDYTDMQLVTSYRYDAWSRLTYNGLPDGTALQRDYAAHSSAELSTQLTVFKADGTSLIAGQQRFDGLDRLTGLTVGKRSESYAYHQGQTQISQRISGAGTTIEYDYDLALTNSPLAIKTSGQQAGFGYHPVSGRITSASNEQGKREYDYDVHNRLRAERWVDTDNKTWETRHSISLLERPLSSTLPTLDGQSAIQTSYGYDSAGRVQSIAQGSLRALFDYNALSQPSKITSLDLAANRKLITELQYDDQGREIRRTLDLEQHRQQVLEQAWGKDGQLQRRHWQQDGQSLLDETFEYDLRGRLTAHLCSGTQLPCDAMGRPISEQTWRFDALDNITRRSSTFADENNSYEVARFSYDPASPCQLTAITYNPPRTEPDPTFTHDADGNQSTDLLGRQLNYDKLGRLLDVGALTEQPASHYHYDGHDRLVTRQQDGADQALCLYDGQRLSSLVQGGRQTCLLHGPEAFEQPLGQQQPDDPSQTLLLLCDANHSVRGDSCQGDLHSTVYSAYGEHPSEPPPRSLSGFNGQWQDQASGWYLLGNGYRAYDPQLMRFYSPDSLSPFGAGGVNPYAYCLGNPIALRDPTGHQSIGWSGRLRTSHENESYSAGQSGGVMAWVFVAAGVVGTAFAVAAAYASFGLLTPVVVAAAKGTVAATASAIASTVAATVSASSASALVAFGSSTASVALGVGASLAGGVEAATGNRTAGEWGQFLGLAAFVTGIVGGLSMARAHNLVNAATKAAQTTVDATQEVVQGATAATALLNDAVGTTLKAAASTATGPFATVAMFGSSVAAIPRAVTRPPPAPRTPPAPQPGPGRRKFYKIPTNERVFLRPGFMNRAKPRDVIPRPTPRD